MNTEMSFMESTPTSISQAIREKLESNFSKAVRGYHIVNNRPIKESVWEEVNTVVLNRSGCDVTSESDGSHKSGRDLVCSLGGFSNKSVKYGASRAFAISSYRLTTVCSDKEHGDISGIIAEINLRKNFDMYSIMARKETKTEIYYEWFLIPNDFPALNPATYTWRPRFGKTRNTNDKITGWETDVLNGSSMSITFSMSSQLWVKLTVTDEIDRFKIGSCKIKRGKTIDYIELYEKSLTF